MDKPTLIIGASLQPERYSNMAIVKLLKYNHTVYAIGSKQGVVQHIIIHTSTTIHITSVHTVSLYINATLQEQYYKYILELKPTRLIFNPGTENEVLYNKATAIGIQCLNACTLVMLQSQLY